MTKQTLILPSKENLVALDAGFRPTTQRSWARDIKRLYGHQCLLTGVESSKIALLEAHHLFPKKQFPLFNFSLLNGIPLEKSVHRSFHRLYGINGGPEAMCLFLNQIESRVSDEHLSRVRIVRDWVEFQERELLSQMRATYGSNFKKA